MIVSGDITYGAGRDRKSASMPLLDSPPRTCEGKTSCSGRFCWLSPRIVLEFRREQLSFPSLVAKPATDDLSVSRSLLLVLGVRLVNCYNSCRSRAISIPALYSDILSEISRGLLQCLHVNCGNRLKLGHASFLYF